MPHVHVSEVIAMQERLDRAELECQRLREIVGDQAATIVQQASALAVLDQRVRSLGLMIWP